MNSNILKELTGSSKVKITNGADLNQPHPKSYTATISGSTKTYNLFSGIVLFLGFYKDMGTVTIAVSNHEIIRYLNMKDIQIWNYSSIEKGKYIGESFAKPGLQFEYCTQWKGESQYPVRINNKLYFKQNPIDILNGSYSPVNEINISYSPIKANNKVTFTQDQLLEWGPTNIDNSDRYIEGAQIVEG